MKFTCKNKCGFVHEPASGMYWQTTDDIIIHKHELECPNGARKEYDGTYQ